VLIIDSNVRQTLSLPHSKLIQRMIERNILNC
jgi:hypothetical protein